MSVPSICLIGRRGLFPSHGIARLLALFFLALIGATDQALQAQDPSNVGRDVPSSGQDTTLTDLPGYLQHTPWEFTPSLLTILFRDTIALWNPALTADHGKLHLEARYQWEDWRTASLWAGYNFGFGEVVQVVLTPMAGAVFGTINGLSPGLLVVAEWRSLSLFSSSQRFLDLEGRSGDFTFIWNELAVDLDHLIIGIVAQRTRAFDSPLDVQRGLLLKREQGNLTFGMYLFNIGWTDPTVAFTLSYGFGTERRSTP
jgi:hypothetical protein